MPIHYIIRKHRPILHQASGILRADEVCFKRPTNVSNKLIYWVTWSITTTDRAHSPAFIAGHDPMWLKATSYFYPKTGQSFNNKGVHTCDFVVLSNRSHIPGDTQIFRLHKLINSIRLVFYRTHPYHIKIEPSLVKHPLPFLASTQCHMPVEEALTAKSQHRHALHTFSVLLIPAAHICIMWIAHACTIRIRSSRHTISDLYLVLLCRRKHTGLAFTDADPPLVTSSSYTWSLRLRPVPSTGL